MMVTTYPQCGDLSNGSLLTFQSTHTYQADREKGGKQNPVPQDHSEPFDVPYLFYIPPRIFDLCLHVSTPSARVNLWIISPEQMFICGSVICLFCISRRTCSAFFPASGCELTFHASINVQ
mmetsp:Transcript_10811/g.25068  ORF Transcript_10811/g.25068 Transcript_10811/m.25068 type:complete len:121 (+) Transcript_10811:196-558(+)